MRYENGRLRPQSKQFVIPHAPDNVAQVDQGTGAINMFTKHATCARGRNVPHKYKKEENFVVYVCCKSFQCRKNQLVHGTYQLHIVLFMCKYIQS